MPARVRIAFTEIADGNHALHTARSEAECDHVLENRARTLAQLGLGLDDLVVGEQIHGAEVATVDRSHRGRGAREAATALAATDGLLTRDPGVALMLLGADCPLVCLLDPHGEAVAVVHAGWRGLVAGVLGAAFEALAPSRGRRSIRVYLSPCAGPCCYEVGEEVASRFPDAAVIRSDGRRPRLDLRAAVAIGLGLPVTLVAGGCTVCGGGHYSYRRDGTHERHALVAALLSTPRIP